MIVIQLHFRDPITEAYIWVEREPNIYVLIMKPIMKSVLFRLAIHSVCSVEKSNFLPLLVYNIN